MHLQHTLDQLVAQYNSPDFITKDPISIPHQFSMKQDIEIAGLIAATFAWGQRKTIINKSNDFLERMEGDPHRFIHNFRPKDLIRFQSFKHRTFNGEDALSFLYFLQSFYRENDSLESFFIGFESNPVYHGLTAFGEAFRSSTATVRRSYKHVSLPKSNSACKRLNMFLRWMVRKDNHGVDFGIWSHLSPADLIIPLDVHVLRSAKKLGLVTYEKPSWKTAESLTAQLRKLDPSDPVKYDFALFNLSIDSFAPGGRGLN